MGRMRRFIYTYHPRTAGEDGRSYEGHDSGRRATASPTTGLTCHDAHLQLLTPRLRNTIGYSDQDEHMTHVASERGNNFMHMTS